MSKYPLSPRKYRTPLYRSCQALQQGGIIAYPTETIYGFGVDAFNRSALRALRDLKGRAQAKGFILLLPSLKTLPMVATQPYSKMARRLMQQFWPGPLTLVLPARATLPLLLTEGGLNRSQRWVAVRLMASPAVKRLGKLWPKPLVSTSANRQGEPPRHGEGDIRRLAGRRVAEVLRESAGHRRLLHDQSQSLPSTVVRVSHKNEITILREGAICREDLFLAARRNAN
ncbi:L-threonylcarbamoyladenylate synthase [Magnetococcales bacterium HHB-1]